MTFIMYSTCLALVFVILAQIKVWQIDKEQSEKKVETNNAQVESTNVTRVDSQIHHLSVGLEPSVIGVGITKSFVYGPESLKEINSSNIGLRERLYSIGSQHVAQTPRKYTDDFNSYD